MSLQDQEGLALLDQLGEPLIDQLRYPAIELMALVQQLTVTTTPSSGSRSAWTTSLSGVTTISVRAADWGACTQLAFVYSPVEGVEGDFAPPAGAEFPVFKVVAYDDEEMVFQIEPSYKNYVVAVIPTANDLDTDIQILFS